MYINTWSAESQALISKMTTQEKDRLNAIIAMHTMVINMNDESAYTTWTYLVPDDAGEQDFIDFAINDEGAGVNHLFDQAATLFKRLWERYAKKDKGLYIGDKCY